MSFFAVLLAIALSAPALADRYLVRPSSPTFFSAPSSDNLGPETHRVVYPGSSAQIMAQHSRLGWVEVEADAAEAERLALRPEVADIEADILFEAPTLAAEESSEASRALSRLGALATSDEIPWNVRAVRADRAWTLDPKAAGRGMRLLVLDTGIDERQPDLIPNFEEGRDFTRSPAVLALPSLLAHPPESAPSSAPSYRDHDGHGTHVAGILAATRNGLGVAGVAPDARLLIGKICSKSGCTATSILKGLEYALERGAHVVNLSIASPSRSKALAAAVKRLSEAGILVVAGSGNSGSDKLGYPAGYESVLSVGAADAAGSARAPFSQYSEKLDLLAPGMAVRRPRHRSSRQKGPFMASPACPQSFGEPYGFSEPRSRSGGRGHGQL